MNNFHKTKRKTEILLVKIFIFYDLTLIWVGFLGVRFEVGWGGGGQGKITPQSKTR